MPMFRRSAFIALTCLALLTWLAACCGRVNHALHGNESAAKPALPASDATQAKGAARNRLVSSLPALQGLAAGSEVDFELRATLVDPVFQGSARIIYDSDLVEPVAARRGDLLPASAIFLAAIDEQRDQLELSDVDRPSQFDNCVPFAFTGRPGTAPISPRSGDLLTVTFRLKAPVTDGVPIRLQNDAEFLQLRGAKGERLSFDLEREAGTR